MTNRTTVFVVCLVYLIGLFFFLDAYSKTFDVSYDATSQSIGGSVDFLGMHFQVGESIISNIVVSISSFPLWINTIFVILPATLCAVFGIMMFIPTIPSG